MSPMNNRRMTPMAEPGILDFAPGAAAAYSLRNLSYTYASPVVTVRRSTDDAEADFTAAEVSDGTLAGWAGADGFVKQWWDQSGNARHATQATTTAQPQIVDSGVLVTEGGKAAVRFDGVDDRLQTAAFSAAITQPVTAFVVTAMDSADTQQIVFGNRSSSRFFIGRNGSATYRMEADAAGSLFVSYGTATGEQTLHSAIFKTAESSGYLNGAIGGSGSVGTGSLDGLTIGNIRGTPSPVAANFGLLGTISEILIYPTDQTALRTRIEGNLAWYY